MPSVHFLDVTNRDGVQTARTGLSKFGKTMINFYLGQLGVAQSEIGFPFLFHEVPYIRANVALAEAGAFGGLRLSGWCRAVTADVDAALAVASAAGPVAPGLRHYNLSISTSDQMIAHKFRGRLDRAAIIAEMTAAVAAARAGGAETVGVNAEDGSRTDAGFLLEFALAARDAGAAGCGTATRSAATARSGSGSASPSWPPPQACRSRRTATTTWDGRGELRVRGARGPGRGQDAWVNTCINGIGERAGNADLLSCLRRPARLGRGRPGRDGDPVDLSWARRFALWASYAFGQPLPQGQPGTGRDAFAHESGIHADGALKDRQNYELYDDETLGPFPHDWSPAPAGSC